jgi:hypothetical protein
MSTRHPGLDTAAAEWTLRDRVDVNEGAIRASLERKVAGRSRKRFDVLFDITSKSAALEDGGACAASLTLTSDAPGDPAAWRCDCPARDLDPCLHAVLVARALSEPVEDRLGDDEAPDPAYACGPVEVPPGLAAAAARSRASIDVRDDAVRVLSALVRHVNGVLACDCPMGEMPACLHRVVVDAWARGLRTARGGGASAGASTSFARSSGTTLPGAAGGAARAPRGETLPPEDVLRFEPVLVRAEALIAEMVSFGLQRSTATTLERARTLSIVARTMGVRDGAPRHAGLGRLVRALDRTSQALEEFQQRIVTTTELDVLRELGIVRNIIRAVRANAGALPLSDFAGATQQEYVTLPALDAQGLGFEAWVTPAGYAGVTAYVADLRTGRVLTRTNALPMDGDEGRSAGWAEGLGAQPAFAGNSLTYLELARGRFLLSGAMIAPDSGRLSGSGKTQVAKRDPLPWGDPKLRAATLLGAGDALRIAERLGFDPLGRPPASPPVALVPVDGVRVSRFDRATQRLVLELTTKSGARLVSGIAYRDDRALYLDNLEKLARATPPPRLVFGRLKVDSEGFGIEPLTAYFDTGRPRHLTFRELDVETSPLPRQVEDDESSRCSS